jgi:hypothetical protein
MSQADGVSSAAAAADQYDHPAPKPQVITLARGQAGSGGAEGDVSWASYLGSSDLNMLRATAVGPDGLYMGGWTPDPDTPGTYDMLLAKTSFDGGTLLNAVALNFPGATYSEVRGIDVDSAGNVYAIGVSNFQGFVARTYLRLDADFQNVRWVMAAGVASEGNAIYHDSRTYTIYVTGNTDARSIGFPAESLQVSWFYDLENPAGPTSIFSYVYTYEGFDGATGTGIGIGPDSTVEVSGTFLLGSNIYAAMHEISPDGATARGVYFDVPGQSSLNSVRVDGAGNAYAAGNIASDTGNGRSELLIAKFDPGLVLEYAYSFGSDTADLAAYGVAVDALGQIYAVGGITYEPGNADVLIAKFTADGSALADSVVAGGECDELALAVAMDPNGTDLYAVGYSISGNFQTTPNVFQPNMGGWMDGIVMKVGNFA